MIPSSSSSSSQLTSPRRPVTLSETNNSYPSSSNKTFSPMNLDASRGNFYDEEEEGSEMRHLYVLPVLLFEFLAIGLTRAVLPSKLLRTFGANVYVIMGLCEFVRGLFAFVACPAFGKFSDLVGRKPCLFITVLGTCAPVCSLALIGDKSGDGVMYIFVVLLAISGLFSATFTLTFAYVSDTVPKGEKRVAAYGLALATFGLSFTIGPMAGGYLARSVEVDEDLIEVSLKEEIALNNEGTEGDGLYTAGKHSPEQSGHTSLEDDVIDPQGEQRVFLFSFFLVMITLLYICYVLPETVKSKSNANELGSPILKHRIQRQLKSFQNDIAPDAFRPLDFLRLFSGDPLLAKIGQIVLLYYTGVYAVVSTMVLYAVKQFHFGPERLGELMSALGLCTMVAEVVLVRMVIPQLGEKKSLKVGLIAFALQCIVLCFAYEGWHLFICVALSMVANLSYPSVTSMVSNAVHPDTVGEALGAMNGIKALTEGIGPLVFGALMTVSEKSNLPGWPYIIAAIFALFAYRVSADLPEDNDESYLSEKYPSKGINAESDRSLQVFMGLLGSLAGKEEENAPITLREKSDQEEEMDGLLSEIDTDWEDEHNQRIEKNFSDHIYNFGSKTPVKGDNIMYHI